MRCGALLYHEQREVLLCATLGSAKLSIACTALVLSMTWTMLTLLAAVEEQISCSSTGVLTARSATTLEAALLSTDRLRPTSCKPHDSARRMFGCRGGTVCQHGC